MTTTATTGLLARNANVQAQPDGTVVPTTGPIQFPWLANPNQPLRATSQTRSPAGTGVNAGDHEPPPLVSGDALSLGAGEIQDVRTAVRESLTERNSGSSVRALLAHATSVANGDSAAVVSFAHALVSELHELAVAGKVPVPLVGHTYDQWTSYALRSSSDDLLARNQAIFAKARNSIPPPANPPAAAAPPPPANPAPANPAPAAPLTSAQLVLQDAGDGWTEQELEDVYQALRREGWVPTVGTYPPQLQAIDTALAQLTGADTDRCVALRTQLGKYILDRAHQDGLTQFG